MSVSQVETRTIINAAQAHAQILGITVSVAVVDEGGLVKALDRMDGAPPLSAQIAEAKAQGAAVWHRDGHVLAEVAQERPAFVSAVSQMTRLPLIAGAGSIVIRHSDGTVTGAVGVSGGKPDEDRACCEAGIGALRMAGPQPSLPITHPLRPPLQRVAPGAGGTTPAWPSYTGTAELVGKSSRGVTVYVDPSLGDPALRNARDLLAAADRVVEQNDAFFGIVGGPVDVIVFALNGQTDGTGGADHGGCDFTTGNAIEVDASYGNSIRVVGLFEAELSECAMNGRLCGLSTGEALSRWCAAVVSSNALTDFATAPQWARDGMPNWVDQAAQTDQDADSTGCGMAFLSWIIGQGHTLSQVAQTMVKLGDAGTLAELYGQLASQAASSAWPSFLAAVQGLAGGVTTDDPFNALGA
jgi:uncharacterized protein GlcG (DUF336 family)